MGKVPKLAAGNPADSGHPAAARHAFRGRRLDLDPERPHGAFDRAAAAVGARRAAGPSSPARAASGRPSYPDTAVKRT